MELGSVSGLTRYGTKISSQGGRLDEGVIKWTYD